ncbi:MAG TPA: MBL fold metallo-hydrolase [Vicinamibacteria bacterium]|nr:MBL fold metallo-hydrolase [Vicinamibacteria bacterium]
MISVVSLVALLLAAPSPVQASTPAASAAASARVKSLKILILSTMLADEGIGEWGFSALVEVDGHRILFDTGARPTTVLENARELKVDLAGVPEVVLSHNHSDHTGGLLTLRKDVQARDEKALARVHVGRGLFWSRPTADGTGESNLPLKTRADYAAAGLTFIEHDSAQQILPGVWLTGPVPRVHPERNWSGKGRVRTPEGLVEDTIPEDQSLVFDTDRGLVILAGCGHAGIVNTVEYARKIVRPAPIHAIVGGLHL